VRPWVEGHILIRTNASVLVRVSYYFIVCGHLLQVDVPLAELEQEKAAIKTLTHPLDTVMDLSIGAGWPSGGSVDSRQNAGQRTRQGSVDLRQVT
jgi:hypothetical protein